jgi:hypothetical protein
MSNGISLPKKWIYSQKFVSAIVTRRTASSWLTPSINRFNFLNQRLHWSRSISERFKSIVDSLEANSEQRESPTA